MKIKAIHAFNTELHEGDYGNMLLDMQGSQYTTYSNIFAENNRPVCVYVNNA